MSVNRILRLLAVKNSQLPPQIKTLCLVLRRGMLKDVFEKSPSQAVVAARGTVAASAADIPTGSLKDIASSAKVYSLYAPSPLSSPMHQQDQSG